MITYDNFWKTMKKKNISQYKLINHYELSTSLIHRLKSNLPITTKTLDHLCNIIGCDVSEILTYTPSENAINIENDLSFGNYVASGKEYKTGRKN